MAGKISQYPSAITTLASGDLFDVSEFLNPGYESKKLDWSTLLTELNSQLTFENIYTTDGTTTGERTISIGTNDLIFGSTGDVNLLRFDATADRIGIGTATPSQKLEVAGNTLVNGRIDVVGLDNSNSTIGFKAVNLANETIFQAANGHILKLANNKLQISKQTDNVLLTNLTATGDIQFDTAGGTVQALRIDGATGNLGIGTATPSQKLDVVGNIISSGRINAGGVTSNNGVLNVRSAGNSFATITSYWQNSDLDEMLQIRDDNSWIVGNTKRGAVGIVGTGGGNFSSRPNATLHVRGSESGVSLRVDDGKVNFGSLPTSAAGLSAGDLWNNAGVINIV